MEAPISATPLQCSQCGGDLHPEEGQIFLTCPYCNATVYVDRSRVVFHWYLAPTLDEGGARASLARWMAGNQTVKDLDQKAQIMGCNFGYFPVWHFKLQDGDNKERVVLEPAAATSITELINLDLPAGDLRKYEASLDSQAAQPTVPLSAALSWLAGRLPGSSQPAEQSLVHIPLYMFKYNYRGHPYTAVVEGGTGGVFANIYPAKAEAPYLLAGGITFLVYLCLAIIPLVGAILGQNNTWISLGLCVGLGIIAMPVLFAMAAYVAAKI